MGRVRARALEVGSAVVVAALLAACGATPVTSAPSTVSATPSPPPTASPTSTPAPTLPPGTLVLDTVSGVGPFALSPDGDYLAALMQDKQSTGTVEVFTVAGTKVTTYPGQGFGWLDATTLAVFQPGADSVNGTVTLHDVAAPAIAALVRPIPGTWSGVLGNGRGALVLDSAVPQGEYGFDHFQVWTSGRLGPLLTTFGTPMGWSPDGSLLVLEASRDTARRSTGVVLANTGYNEAEVHVLRFPAGQPLAVFPSGLIVDSPAYFSRDGRYLAASGTGTDRRPQGPVIVDLTTGSVRSIGVDDRVLGWTPDDRVVLMATDGHTRLWAPDGTLADSGLPAGAVGYGPTMTDVAAVASGLDAPTWLTIQSSRGMVVVPMHNNPPPESDTVWTADGQAVFVDTLTTDAQQVMDQLLRVPVP